MSGEMAWSIIIVSMLANGLNIYSMVISHRSNRRRREELKRKYPGLFE